MASANLPAATSSCARCASRAASGACANSGQARRIIARAACSMLDRGYPEENARSGGQPVHLAAEGLFLAGVGRHAHQLSAFLFQVDPELKRIPQVLVHDQEVGTAVRVLEFADQESSADRRTDISLSHFHGG